MVNSNEALSMRGRGGIAWHTSAVPSGEEKVRHWPILKTVGLMLYRRTIWNSPTAFTVNKDSGCMDGSVRMSATTTTKVCLSLVVIDFVAISVNRFSSVLPIVFSSLMRFDARLTTEKLV
ncbi:hypothetical protein AGDE_00366 [Angomonas deanei]|nr:hypothetical protein AGDE_07544 [Angomonas deanei]EPY43555.1 hypothetical protein AGDE_00366 [Angomonas deanei]|eukprot:EPY35187.1 hypothetical protein AGDE_07544 [Angomonas deanei]